MNFSQPFFSSSFHATTVFFIVNILQTSNFLVSKAVAFTRENDDIPEVTMRLISVIMSVPLWKIRIFGLFFHAKSGYPDFIRIFLCAGLCRPLYTV